MIEATEIEDYQDRKWSQYNTSYKYSERTTSTDSILHTLP
jgi:hypothetical protein